MTFLFPPLFKLNFFTLFYLHLVICYCCNCSHQVVRQLPNMQTNPCKKGSYGVFGTYLGYKKVRAVARRACAQRDLRRRATRGPAESSSTAFALKLQADDL